MLFPTAAPDSLVPVDTVVVESLLFTSELALLLIEERREFRAEVFNEEMVVSEKRAEAILLCSEAGKPERTEER